MKTITSSIFFAFVLLVGIAPPASAIEYPWCAYYAGRGGGGGTNCGFSTFEQCRAAISGVGGSCAQNPSYTAPAGRKAKRVRKHRSS